MKVLTWLIVGLTIVATCLALRNTSGYKWLTPLPPAAPSAGELVNTTLGYPATSSVNTAGSPVGGDNIPKPDSTAQKYGGIPGAGPMARGPGTGGMGASGGGGGGGGKAAGGSKPNPKKGQGKKHKRYCIALY
jgi:hypothetical protein